MGHTTPASTGATSGCSTVSGEAICFGYAPVSGLFILYSDANERAGR
jgi:hypothetical protein